MLNNMVPNTYTVDVGLNGTEHTIIYATHDTNAMTAVVMAERTCIS